MKCLYHSLKINPYVVSELAQIHSWRCIFAELVTHFPSTVVKESLAFNAKIHTSSSSSSSSTPYLHQSLDARISAPSPYRPFFKSSLHLDRDLPGSFFMFLVATILFFSSTCYLSFWLDALLSVFSLSGSSCSILNPGFVSHPLICYFSPAVFLALITSSSFE